MQQPMIVPWQQKVNSLCIGLAGVKGTGKQALAEQIKDFADVPIIPDGVEGYMRNKALIRNTLGNRQLLKVYLNVLTEKKTIERGATKFVAVGTVLDYVSDLLATMAHDTDLKDILEGYMKESAVHTLMCYDVIFMMPFVQKNDENDVFRATQHMLTTQGAMEAQPIVLMHPIQSDSLADQTAECLEVIEKMTLAKARVAHHQKGGQLEDLPQPTRPS